MAGIYIHIPFCQSRCIYCDFYSTSFLSLQSEYMKALIRELEERQEELPTRARTYNTIYVGGGTPSTLPPALLIQLFESITRIYPIAKNAEVTVEANPDDVTQEWIQALKETPVNRVSMGMQTFDDQLLRFLHRRHDSQQAKNAIDMLQVAGYENLSLDLIYGIPGQTKKVWQHDVATALSLNVPHISAYSLMYEEGTRLTRMRDEGLVKEIDEETSLWCYDYLCEQLQIAGLEHYEISNFARPGYASLHNSSYWQGLPYLGFGAGAHSYDGKRLRRWNVPDIKHYIETMSEGNGERTMYFETEELTDTDLYNEYVMTRLRTHKGFSLSDLQNLFGEKAYNYCLNQARPYIERKELKIEERDCLSLTQKGILISNQIMSDLFQ